MMLTQMKLQMEKNESSHRNVVKTNKGGHILDSCADA